MSEATEQASQPPDDSQAGIGAKVECPRCRSTEHATVKVGPSNAAEVWCDNCKAFHPVPERKTQARTKRS